MIDPTLKERAIDAITRICLEKALMLTPQEAGMIADAVLALGRRAGMIEAAALMNMHRGADVDRIIDSIRAAADGIKP